MIKKLLIIVSIVILSIVVLSYVLYLLGSSWCSEKYLSKAYSPDGKYFAEAFTSSCGGAAGDSTTNVVINKIDEKYLLFFGYNRTNVFAINGIASIKPLWIDDKTLKITYTNCENVYSQNESWKDIKIVYEEKCLER